MEGILWDPKNLKKNFLKDNFIACDYITYKNKHIIIIAMKQKLHHF